MEPETLRPTSTPRSLKGIMACPLSDFIRVWSGIVAGLVFVNATFFYLVGEGGICTRTMDDILDATFYTTNSRINIHNKEILWDHSTFGGRILKARWAATERR